MINDVPISVYVNKSKSWFSFTASVIGICVKINNEPISSTIANKIPCELVGKLDKVFLKVLRNYKVRCVTGL